MLSPAIAPALGLGGQPAQAIVQGEPALGEPIVRTGRDRQAAVGISDGGSRQQRLSDVAVAARPRQPDVVEVDRVDAGRPQGVALQVSTAACAPCARATSCRLEARTASAATSPIWVNTVQDLSARGVGLRVLAGDGAQIDTTTAAGRFVFGIFAALAEFERELIRERTVAGLKAARVRGQDFHAAASSTSRHRLRTSQHPGRPPTTSVTTTSHHLSFERRKSRTTSPRRGLEPPLTRAPHSSSARRRGLPDTQHVAPDVHSSTPHQPLRHGFRDNRPELRRRAACVPEEDEIVGRVVADPTDHGQVVRSYVLRARVHRCPVVSLSGFQLPARLTVSAGPRRGFAAGAKVVGVVVVVRTRVP